MSRLYDAIEQAESDAEYVAAWRAANEARRGQESSVFVSGCTIRIPGDTQVFSPDPAMTNATGMLLRLAGDFNGKSVLDVGTGTGVIAVVAAKAGARPVVATDIHGPSLVCAHDNAEANGLGAAVSIIESDVFANVDGMFDLIIANLPFGDIYGHLGINRDAVAYRFFSHARGRLNDGGRILAAGASFGNIDVVRRLLGDMEIAHVEHKERKYGVEWSVFEIGAP